MACTTDTVRVRVPATSANLGPGFDALGLALSLYDQVVLARFGQVRPLAGDLDGQPALTDPRVHLVVQAQREPERVEAGAEVGAGRGHAHPHRIGRPGHLTPRSYRFRSRHDVTLSRL